MEKMLDIPGTFVSQKVGTIKNMDYISLDLRKSHTFKKKVKDCPTAVCMAIMTSFTFMTSCHHISIVPV